MLGHPPETTRRSIAEEALEIVDLMEHRNINIMCVQETIWKGEEESEIGNGYRLFYYGTEAKLNGVGVVLDPTDKENGIPGTERIWIGGDLNGHVGMGNEDQVKIDIDCKTLPRESVTKQHRPVVCKVKVNSDLKGDKNWNTAQKRVAEKVKGRIHTVIVRPTTLYGLEATSLIKAQEVAEMKMQSWGLGLKRKDTLRNEVVLKRVGVKGLHDQLKESRLRWGGRVLRRDMVMLEEEWKGRRWGKRREECHTVTEKI
ncbi:uncharacterized protein LOC125025555 [Penaeus chinensis]|uniref:uncharacterized protein LOC125025555 n=1 Tax=Penaeus chinensis TaxID=139456 RepID=UPI001FB67F22|nr:uncharacterized protein LOC125025555 [Penaeus chinensis]